jgi:branched-chain amino acid transport system permease protein
VATAIFWLIIVAIVAYLAWVGLRVPAIERRRTLSRGSRALVGILAVLIIIPFISKTAAPQLRPWLVVGLIAAALVALAVPARWRKLAGLGAAVVFFLVIPFFMPAYQNNVFTDYAIFALAALSLNMLVGMSGEVSLGHGALLAIGGYTAAIMMHQQHVPFFVTVLVGAIIAAAVGVLLGVPSVRLTGPYLAIATLGLAISMPSVGKWIKIGKWTGGAQGITLIGNKGLPKVPSFLQTLPGGHKLTFDEYQYFIVLLVFAVSALLVWNFHRSRTGRAVLAVRDSGPAAQVVGINLGAYKVLVFVFSSFLAGVAGAFLVLRVQSIAPDTYGLDLSIQILAMIVIGGIDSIAGSVAGAIFIRWLVLQKTALPSPTKIPMFGAHLPSQFSTFSTYGAGVYYGIALILVMILMPYGIAGAFDRFGRLSLRDRLLRRPVPAPVAVATPNEMWARPKPTEGETMTTQEVTPR